MPARDMSGIDRSVKAELRVGTRTCQCADCGAFFTGVEGFDLHMVGDDLRCLSPAEMRRIGMTVNEHGVWARGTANRKAA